ncbi:NUDIX domain-containing protein [Lacticaseibacillus thailandensis]|nr:NUDIX domain-containing protein [Lacticaseibacillus thailandensis]
MQEADDLRLLVAPDKWFSVRAAVLLVHGTDVLVRVMSLPQGQTGILLPGGAVKFNESAVDAGAREMHEELKLDDLDLRMVGVTENFWPLNQEVQAHQLMMIMMATLSADQYAHVQSLDMEQVDLPAHTRLAWLPLAQVRASIRPTAVGALLGTDDQVHYGVDRRDA